MCLICNIWHRSNISLDRKGVPWSVSRYLGISTWLNRKRGQVHVFGGGFPEGDGIRVRCSIVYQQQVLLMAMGRLSEWPY